MQQVWFLLKIIEACLGTGCIAMHLLGVIIINEPTPHHVYFCGIFFSFTVVSLMGAIAVCSKVWTSPLMELIICSLAFLTHAVATFISMAYVQHDVHIQYMSRMDEPKHEYFRANRYQSICSLMTSSIYLLHFSLACDAYMINEEPERKTKKMEQRKSNFFMKPVQVEESDTTKLKPLQLVFLSRSIENQLMSLKCFRRIMKCPDDKKKHLTHIREDPQNTAADIEANYDDKDGEEHRTTNFENLTNNSLGVYDYLTLSEEKIITPTLSSIDNLNEDNDYDDTFQLKQSNSAIKFVDFLEYSDLEEDDADDESSDENDYHTDITEARAQAKQNAVAAARASAEKKFGRPNSSIDDDNSLNDKAEPRVKRYSKRSSKQRGSSSSSSLRSVDSTERPQRVKKERKTWKQLIIQKGLVGIKRQSLQKSDNFIRLPSKYDHGDDTDWELESDLDSNVMIEDKTISVTTYNGMTATTDESSYHTSEFNNNAEIDSEDAYLRTSDSLNYLTATSRDDEPELKRQKAVDDSNAEAEIFVKEEHEEEGEQRVSKRVTIVIKPDSQEIINAVDSNAEAEMLVEEEQSEEEGQPEKEEQK